MKRPVVRVVAASAAILLLAVWLIAPRQSIAFGDLIAPIVEAKSARFKVVTQNEAQAGEMSGTGYFLAPNMFRNEVVGQDKKKINVVTIADFDRGRMLTLMPEQKEAMVFELQGQPDESKRRANNFFGDLRDALAEYRRTKQGHVEELGEKDIDGRRAFGFRLAASGMVQTLWGDAKTGQIIRIESTMKGPPKTEVVMSDFEFDVPLDASLFDLNPPDGYKMNTIPVDVTPPTEQDFIAALERLSDAIDGEFPTSLDTPGITTAMVKLLGGKDSKEMMTEGMKIGRGLGFAMSLPADADPHYAGKGVKQQQDPEVPIFWYKPAGAENYRIIWSDLTTSDADTAPDVPGAIRMIEPLGKPKAD